MHSTTTFAGFEGRFSLSDKLSKLIVDTDRTRPGVGEQDAPPLDRGLARLMDSRFRGNDGVGGPESTIHR